MKLPKISQQNNYIMPLDASYFGAIYRSQVLPDIFILFRSREAKKQLLSPQLHK
jgi:hypothetical protein